MSEAPSIEAVLFDYGMVLSGPADPAAWARMIEIIGLDPETFEAAYWAPRHEYDRGTHTGAEYWHLVGQHGGVELSASRIDALLDADVDLWTRTNQPMIDWAARLQMAGTRTGILSNLGDQMTEGVLRRMKWLSGFHHRTFSHSHKIAKPEAEIYRLAAAGLGAPAGRILFIDDREDNCEAGRVAGMHVLQYLDHTHFVRDLSQMGLERLWVTGKQ